MPTDALQPFMAPFAKLAQSNLELLTRFTFSPEAVSQSMAQLQRLFAAQPSPGMPLQLPTNALAELMAGLTKNYMEFLAELSQGSVALIQQTPVTLAPVMQEAVRKARAA